MNMPHILCVLVTGSEGFVGRNLCATLRYKEKFRLLTFDLIDSVDSLANKVEEANVIIHLAGVNRPIDDNEFETGNIGLTERIVNQLIIMNKKCTIIMASTTQAILENPYGRSKRAAENLLFEYQKQSGADVYIYRLPNLFGKWSKPNYNSVVATFCHNIARGLPIQVDNPNAPLKLVHIDDLIDELLRAVAGQPNKEGDYYSVPVIHKTTVGELADLLQTFKAGRSDLTVPNLQSSFVRKLYSTYLSNLPEDEFGYSLNMIKDLRGSFTEFIKTPDRGQISVNISHPGITKGNHWHHTKHEKFLVVSGRDLIRFRKLGTKVVISREVSGEYLEVIDIPPGYTHNITNIGAADLVTIIWVNKAHDPSFPDTWFEEI